MLKKSSLSKKRRNLTSDVLDVNKCQISNSKRIENLISALVFLSRKSETNKVVANLFKTIFCKLKHVLCLLALVSGTKN